MKTKVKMVLAGILVTGLMGVTQAQAHIKYKMTTKTPANIMVPDKLETSIGTMNFFDGVPDDASVDKVYDYIDRSRAVEAFLNCIPAMSSKSAGKGSDYSMGMVDSKGRPLDGSKTYKLNLPPNIPVKDFWALTMYDTQTRCQLQTDQQFPTLDSYKEGMKVNKDGSSIRGRILKTIKI